VVAVTATGTLSAREAVQVGSEITGRVLEVLVDFNDRVTQGQVLARIDTEQYQARLDETRAQLAAAEAALKNAEATAREEELRIGRIRSLYQAKLASKQELEQAEASYARSQAAVASARAQRTSAQASLKVSRSSLSKAVIVSPIDGIVLDRTVEPGQTVTSGLQTPVLFTLAADLTELRLDIKVDEADVGQVREGLVATFTVDAYPGREFTSKVLAVKNMPTTEQSVVTYEARLSVDNAERLLRPGMTATASVIVSRKEAALLVPNAALRFTPPQAASARSDRPMPLSRLMRGRPPPARAARRSTPSGGGGSSEGRGKGRSRDRAAVWVLEKARPLRVNVKRGTTDGVHTEVIADKLREGARVIVGLAESQGG
jgi:HlyD family secretion protein